MKTFRGVSAAVVMAALAMAAGARGDTLADRAPADAIGFLSWAGTDALGKSYDESHLKGLVETLNLPQVITQAFDDAMKKENDPAKAAEHKQQREWVMTAIKSPTAVYFGPMDFTNADEPGLKAAVYSQMGKEKAAEYAGQINAMVEKEMKDRYPPMHAAAVGDFLLVTIGSVPEMEKRLSGAAPADGLSKQAGFEKAVAQVGVTTSQPALLFYGDVEAGLKMLSDGVEAKGGFEAEMFPTMMDAMGLTQFHKMAVAGNFDGANWVSQMFVGLAEKRTGYAALLDSKPLKEDALKLIPKGATTAGVIRLDGPRLFNDIRDAAAQIDAQNGQRGFDMAMQQFFAFTGVDLLKDLLEPMDDTYVLYGVPGGKANSFEDLVIASKFKDAQKVETAFTTLESVLNTMMQQRGTGDDVSFKTESFPPPNDKLTAHIIATQAMSPAWTVSDGVGYFSLSREGLQGAIEGAGKTASITENPEFQKLWEKVGRKEMSNFVFLDLPKLTVEFYPRIEKWMAEHDAEPHPDEKIPFSLPAVEKLNENLTPGMAVYWTDKEGYHSKAAGPAPLMEFVRPETLLEMILVFDLTARPAVEKVVPAAPAPMVVPQR